MGEKVCPGCGARYPADSMLTICPNCQKPLIEVKEEEAQEPAAPAKPAPETPQAGPPTHPEAPKPPAEPAGPSVGASGIKRIPCPNCGELLYETEMVCWRCKTPVRDTAAARPGPPPAAETPGFAPPPPAQQPGAPAPPPQPTAPPYVPPAQPATAGRSAADSLANLALWLSGAGCLVGWCICPALSIAGLILGIKAKADGSDKATLPIVLGAIGTVAALAGIVVGFLSGLLRGLEGGSP